MWVVGLREIESSVGCGPIPLLYFDIIPEHDVSKLFRCFGLSANNSVVIPSTKGTSSHTIASIMAKIPRPADFDVVLLDIGM